MKQISHHSRLLLVMTAQVVLSATFIIGYFLLVAGFLLGHAKIPPDYKDMFMCLLSVLTAGVMLILNFWFSRTRGSTDNASPPIEPL